jgi:hypothetical protein
MRVAPQLAEAGLGRRAVQGLSDALAHRAAQGGMAPRLQ